MKVPDGDPYSYFLQLVINILVHLCNAFSQSQGYSSMVHYSVGILSCLADTDSVAVI